MLAIWPTFFLSFLNIQNFSLLLALQSKTSLLLPWKHYFCEPGMGWGAFPLHLSLTIMLYLSDFKVILQLPGFQMPSKAIERHPATYTLFQGSVVEETFLLPASKQTCLCAWEQVALETPNFPSDQDWLCELLRSITEQLSSNLPLFPAPTLASYQSTGSSYSGSSAAGSIVALMSLCPVRVCLTCINIIYVLW